MGYIAAWIRSEGLRIHPGEPRSMSRSKGSKPITVLALIPFFSIIEGLGEIQIYLKGMSTAENRFIVVAKPTWP